MRSSKNRSRNKQNRNRSMGNVVNRVFDSSGPEGKVRGTPQQIIEKYGQLARDAHLSNDRVAAENFQQHAEHYTRMLGEAMREQEARREAQEAQQQQQQQNRNRNRDRDAGADQPGQQQQNADRGAQPQPGVDPAAMPQPETPDIVEVPENADAGLVETPEAAPAPKPRRPRRQKPKPEEGAAPTPDGEAPKAAE